MQRCPPVVGSLVKVELTPEAKKVADKWKRGNAYYIPVQARVLLEITGISYSTPSDARVEFSWQYKDITTFAPPSPYARGASPGVALLRLYDDGWRVLRTQM